MSHWANKYVIGLTGNIAVGKSVVRQMLQHLGAYTIDADGLVHQAMAPGAPAYKPIVQTFGELILDSEKRINRAMLGSIVFSNPAALAKLEAVTHPIVRQGINILITRAKQQVIVVEAIKLLEGELAGMVDEIWVVDARPETQYQRLIDKRKMPAEEAKKRILAQNAQADKLKRANLVIQNNGNVEETWKQVQTAWNAIQKKLQPAPAAPAAPAKPASTPAQEAPTMPTKPAPTNQIKAPTQPLARPVAVDDDEDAPIPSANIDTSGINVKRGMPNNAQQIAEFITVRSGQPVDRMDVMLSFGEKSYLIAQNPSSQLEGLMGWQVENLITRVDEFYINPGASKRPVVHALILAVEAASKELQSEVGFVFVPHNLEQDVLHVFNENGYNVTTVKEIKIPAWREAIQDANVNDMMILQKPLRKDRVLKPI